MARKKESERQVISAFKNRRPYGVKLSLLLEESTKLNIDGECSLLITPGYVLKMAPSKSSPTFSPSGSQCWDVLVEGFATAGEAEQVGLKVSMGFLWAAVSRQYSLRLLYHTPLPCSVYDRTKGSGRHKSCRVSLTVGENINNVFEPLNRIISSSKQADQKLLVAMELFASARMETTERSRFVGIISSIEPLACQRKYDNEELTRLISVFQEELSESSMDQELKDSLRNKIDNLRIESISKAIRRLVAEKLPGDVDALAIIDEAYGIRSRILHDGATDADLEIKGREAEAVIRRLFEEILADFALP